MIKKPNSLNHIEKIKKITHKNNISPNMIYAFLFFMIMMGGYKLYDNKSSTDTHITDKSSDRNARSIQNLISVLSDDTGGQEHDEDDGRANSDEPNEDITRTPDQEEYIKNKQIYLDRYVNTYTNINRGIRNDINKKLYLKIASKVQGSTATTIDRTKTFVWPISSPHILPTYLDDLSQGIDIENRIGREVMSIGHGVVKSIKGSTVTIVYEVGGVDIEVSYTSPGNITVKKNQAVTMGRNIYKQVPIESVLHIQTSIGGQSIFPPYLFDPSSVTLSSEKPKITEEITNKPKKQEGGGEDEDEKGENEEDEKDKESLTHIDLPSGDAISSYIDQLLQDNDFGDVDIKPIAKKYLLALNKNNTNKVNIQGIAAFMGFDFQIFTDGIYSIESKDQGKYTADNLPTLKKINKKKKAKNKKELNIYTQSAIGKYQMIWSFILENGQQLGPNGSNLDICTYNIKDVSKLSDRQKVKHITGRSNHRSWLLNTPEGWEAQEKMMKRSIISALNTIATHPKVVKQCSSLTTQDLYVLLSIRHFCGTGFLEKCLKRLDDPKKFMQLLNDRHDRLGTSGKDYIEKFLRLYRPSQAKHTIKISKKSTSSGKIYYTAK